MVALINHLLTYLLTYLEKTNNRKDVKYKHNSNQYSRFRD